jgi:hypothetical protein
MKNGILPSSLYYTVKFLKKGSFLLCRLGGVGLGVFCDNNCGAFRDGAFDNSAGTEHDKA